MDDPMQDIVVLQVRMSMTDRRLIKAWAAARGMTLRDYLMTSAGNYEAANPIAHVD